MAVPIHFPPFPPSEEVRGASVAERRAMYAAWDREFVRMNPAYFHSDGTRRSFWNRLLGGRK